ncbi:MAG: hypothetical protein ABR949_10905 [Candidatus Aquilonibacter sp.]|jgi:hypothetical protein
MTTLRIRLAFALFALAMFAAACGGGGKSGMLPNAGNSGGGTVPSSTKTTNAVIVLKIPAPGQQVSRRPFYVSSGTESLGALVVSATSTETPSPTNLTIFPVATPSPCAAASGGGYTCTLTVTAPIGVDNFFVGAFATASPNANAVPLSEYIALNITVSASPAPNATPLTFTLDGVVYKVVLSVPSPDPSNTPDTQVFPAGVAVAAQPLGVTAYDASNTPILTNITDTFADPIVIAASPAADGIALSINGATCSSGGGATVSIDCAADLNHVQFAYDGTPRPDANDHIIDTFTISTTTQQVNPTPSPAHVVLSSNALSWQLGPNDSELYQGQLTLNSTGQFVYMATDGDGGNYVGTFDPSTQTVINNGTLNEVSYPENFALDSSGTFWLADSGYGDLDCWPSVQSAASSTPPPQTIYPQTPGGDTIFVTAVAVDAANNVWYVGYDTDSCDEECEARHRYQAESIPSTDPGFSYAGFFPAAACGSVNALQTASAFLTDDQNDDYPFVAPLNSGSGNGIFVASYIANSEGNGAYVITTSSSNVNPVTSQLNGGAASGMGAAVDGAGTAYAAFYDGSTADIETVSTSGSAFNTLLGLPSTSGSPTPPVPIGLNVFSPTGGAADRIDYADQTFDTLGLVESVPASPMPLLAPLPNGAYPLWATHSSKGGEYVLGVDSSGNLDVARVIPTTTWSVPAAQFTSACSQVEGLLGIVERGDRGPFTVTYNAPTTLNTPLPGTDHDYLAEFSSASSLTATVQDAGGRTETYPISIVTIPTECGIAHRPLHRGPRVRARIVR